jgi:hypothetical protein
MATLSGDLTMQMESFGEAAMSMFVMELGLGGTIAMWLLTSSLTCQFVGVQAATLLFLSYALQTLRSAVDSLTKE